MRRKSSRLAGLVTCLMRNELAQKGTTSDGLRRPFVLGCQHTQALQALVNVSSGIDDRLLSSCSPFGDHRLIYRHSVGGQAVWVARSWQGCSSQEEEVRRAAEGRRPVEGFPCFSLEFLPLSDQDCATL